MGKLWVGKKWAIVGNLHYQIWNTFRCFQRLAEWVKDLNLRCRPHDREVAGSNPNFALNRASRKWARVGKNGQCSLLNFEHFLLSNLLLKSILKNKRHLMSKCRNLFLIVIHYLLQYVKLYWIEYVDNYVHRNHRDNPCDRHRRLTAKYIDRHAYRRTDP